MTRLTNAEDAAVILQGMAADGWVGVYVLGCIDQRVTIYSQQVRALNLAAALVATKRVKVGDTVVVVGAGAAGLTCAAALQHLQVKVVVLEAEVEILSMFRGKSNRWLHPAVYDWPRSGWSRESAELPLLNWKQGAVGDVLVQLEKGWIAAKGGTDLHCGVSEVRLGSKNDRPREVIWNPSGSQRTETVILAVGFGREPERAGEPSYWKPDTLEEPNVDKPRKWLLSGCGDGALTDLFRLCINKFRHAQMLRDFTSDSGMRHVRQAIRKIEEDDAALQDDPLKLHNAYMSIDAPSVLDKLQARLRNDTLVTLATSSDTFLTNRASPLNRFLAAQLFKADAFKLIPSRVASAEPDGVETVVTFDDGTCDRFDSIQRRHGPDSALQQHFGALYEDMETDRAERRDKPRFTDRTRKPRWTEGVFGSEHRSKAPHGARPKSLLATIQSHRLLPATEIELLNLAAIPKIAKVEASPNEYNDAEIDLAQLLDVCHTVTRDGFRNLSTYPAPLTVDPALTEALNAHMYQFPTRPVDALSLAAALAGRANRYTKDVTTDRAQALSSHTLKSPALLIPTTYPLSPEVRMLLLDAVAFDRGEGERSAEAVLVAHAALTRGRDSYETGPLLALLTRAVAAGGLPVKADGLIDAARRITAENNAQSTGDIIARLEAAFSLRDELVRTRTDSTETQEEISKLRGQQRNGPTMHAGEFLEDGRYRLIEMIGRGGFGTAWKAYDRESRRVVATKILHGQHGEDPSYREAIFANIREMRRLQHPNVVRVLLPKGEYQGFYYYIMEYTPGGDFNQAVLAKRLSKDQMLMVIDSVAAALDAVHKLDLVHRNVKPQNILLRESGAPALSDFDMENARNTMEGGLAIALESVLYAAPEIDGTAGTVDHRADIYSLGMTTVFCLYGNRLPQAALYQHDVLLDETPCNEMLRAVLKKAVALRPEDRFQSMADFRAELTTARRIQEEHPQPPT